VDDARGTVVSRHSLRAELRIRNLSVKYGHHSRISERLYMQTANDLFELRREEGHDN
jgi:hypothetical protein